MGTRTSFQNNYLLFQIHSKSCVYTDVLLPWNRQCISQLSTPHLFLMQAVIVRSMYVGTLFILVMMLALLRCFVHSFRNLFEGVYFLGNAAIYIDFDNTSICNFDRIAFWLFISVHTFPMIIANLLLSPCHNLVIITITVTLILTVLLFVTVCFFGFWPIYEQL